MRSSLTVNRYYFDSISTVLRIDIGYTWVLYLGILPSVTAKLPDLWFFGAPCIDNSVGSQSVTCLLELRLRCTVALYLVCPVCLTYLIMVKLLFKVKVWFLGK